MNLVYIHGANASPDSFNFIRMNLGGNDLVLEYDSANGFHNNLKSMRAQLDGIEDIFFIAHSLGGIYAAHLAQHLAGRVQGAVTLATPYGGSKAAEWIKWLLPFSQLLEDIQPYSAAILQANSIPLLLPWTNIVTTKGHSSLMLTANDGVVTAASMRHRSDIRLVEVAVNHYEVLLSHQAITVIRAALERTVENIYSGSAACI
ncbi:hypothetical protein [Glaciimonas sp. PCH181]|uniref:hypothetical protein n=1 Tax=Glaciimonas sp. PCH181 TaxID=2133943 RepID=UPI000D34FE01|nr:hypothetical protein [Glaciimonas sp. PCH181]PUA19170.1 hypothetical protein C7W93_04560 [Glaciimonas sp. PCH181]